MDSSSFEQTVLKYLQEIKESLEEIRSPRTTERYLTLKEAAKYTRKSTSWLYRNGEETYKAVKIGGEWVFDRLEIDRVHGRTSQAQPTERKRPRRRAPLTPKELHDPYGFLKSPEEMARTAARRQKRPGKKKPQ